VVSGLWFVGFRVQDLGFRCRISKGLGFRVYSLGFKFRISGSWFQVFVGFG
jgi:hypothetical protein